MNVLINATTTGLWHDIIHEAESACRVNLPTELESYLVFLLMRYTNKPQVAHQIMASDFMEALNLSVKQREIALQQVGDSCLLFSGLFPGVAEKRLVKISYFINLGRSAYGAISNASTDVYGLLTHQFVSLMDILHSMRQFDLLPLQAYELWNESGSQRALKILGQYTSAIPHNSHPGEPVPGLIRIKK